MGIQDRDYYRNEGPSVFDSLIPRGVMCRWLIAINVGVFFLQMVSQATGEPWVNQWFVLDVNAVRNGQVWRLLTYAFLHGGYIHIFFNMLFLWWFGSDIEQLYGRHEFLAIYLTSALCGGIAYEAWELAWGSAIPCLGASGSIMTMLILCAFHYPRRIIYAFSILPIPIWLFAIFSLLGDFLGLINPTGVAVVVHITGAAFAAVYYKSQRNITQMLSGLMWWRNRRPRARLKLFQPDPEREEPVAVSANSSTAITASGSYSVDEHLEAKLDAILEKIAKLGKDSLTQEEQQILQQASQMYKKRRT
ncbi:MAG TPA: rhomboid family intramembrane serine protease [Gemmataceae bacterium]|nr:rhomboid family intramembrane serine protease [Gemmataceae bacterium]